MLTGVMPVQERYAPSPEQWVRDQIQEYESSGGTRGTMRRGMPVVVLTTRGAKAGLVRKTPLMRVERGGAYAVVASKGGAPEHPVWYANLLADYQRKTDRAIPAFVLEPVVLEPVVVEPVVVEPVVIGPVVEPDLTGETA
jgi:deazaflavin-dependent oxidoreductase (nitroreductase family)